MTHDLMFAFHEFLEAESWTDHTADLLVCRYLMDPKMEFVKFFGKNYDVSGLADGIVEQIKGHEVK